MSTGRLGYDFDATWIVLEAQGACDSVGSVEYDRVREEFKGVMTNFIRRRSNIGPSREYDRAMLEYSDDDLLIELRRRGRIARVEGSNVTPGHFVEDYTEAMQFKTLMLLLADEAVRLLATHEAIPGAVVSAAGHAVFGQPDARRMSMPLNIIVEKGFGS